MAEKVKPHVLVVTIEGDGCTHFKVECPHSGPDSPCGCFTEGDHKQPCRCPEIGDGERCGPCEDGNHYACEWGRNFDEIGAECQCEPMDECGYQVQIDNIGSEALDFGRGEFVLRVPVILSQGSWEDPIVVTKDKVRDFCADCEGAGEHISDDGQAEQCRRCEGDGYEPEEESCPECGHVNEGGMQAPGGYSGCPTCGWCL